MIYERCKLGPFVSYSLADTLGCLQSKNPGGYKIMTDRGESEKSNSSSSSVSSAAVDRKEAKSIEEKPLLSDIGTDVDKYPLATVNHEENEAKVSEEEKMPMSTKSDANNGINSKDEKSGISTEDSKGTVEDSKNDDDAASTGKENKESSTANSTTSVPDKPFDPAMVDWDRELLREGYVPTPRPKLLATRTPHYEPPPGAKFYKSASWHSILEIEYEDPFEDIKLFNLIGVEKQPVTLKDVPAEYRPYEGCIFVSMYCCCL